MKYFFFAIGVGMICVAAVFIPRHDAHAATSTVIDATVETNNNSHNGTTFTDVFTSSSTGYAFYRDANGACVYSKTTNGGTTWGAAVTVDSQTDCLRVSVWYDRWTPGNTSGTIVHIATIDSGSDDTWYTRLDTSNDSKSTTVDLTHGVYGGTYTAGTVLQAITESTDGKIYIGLYNTGDDFVVRCSSSCTASSSWSAVGTVTDWGAAVNDWMQLSPLPGGDVLNTRFSIGSSTVTSKVWHNTSSSWDAGWVTLDGSCTLNTTYDGAFGSAVNSISNAIYIAYVCNNKPIKKNTGSIRTATYSGGTWTNDADVETNSALGLTGAKLGLDINTGNIYVVYTGRSTANTASTTDVYYKISTSTTMSAWGTLQGPINETTTDIYGARIDGMSNARLYATWIDGNDSSIDGQTIAVFSPTTYVETAYKFFQNQDSAQVGNPFDAQNASSIIPLAGNPFRLRMLIGIGGGAGADIDSQYFKLQYATSTNGACATDFSDGLSYVDIGTATSSLISFYNNPTPANGATLTANSQDPTDGTNVIVNQTYVEQNNFSNDVAKIFSGQDGKWDFSLINNSGATGNNFCFRVVKSDGSLLGSGYNAVASAQVDAAPTMGSVTLNGGNNITLIEGTTTLIKATATVSDSNGSADIFSIGGALYRTSVGSSCAADNNDCYIGTGANCSIDSCAGTSCSVECDYKVWYYAQPTDAGTPWAGDSWSALMQASDTVLSGSSATSSGVPLLSLLAFTTTSTLNYGSFNQGQAMTTLTAPTVIISKGNTAMNVEVYGTNMTGGSFSIPVGQQHFATTSLAYASGTALLANPGSTLGIDLPKPTSTSNPSSTLFWGIAIPSGQMATSYTGFNSFIGVEASLPWP